MAISADFLNSCKDKEVSVYLGDNSDPIEGTFIEYELDTGGRLLWLVLGNAGDEAARSMIDGYAVTQIDLKDGQ